MDKRLGKYLLIPTILMILSTLFVKQHNIIDVIGGLAIAYFAYWFYSKRISSTELSSK